MTRSKDEGVILEPVARHDDETVKVGTVFGNEVFEAAVNALGLESDAARSLLDTILKAVGHHRSSLTIEDLGFLLPEIEKRLRALLHDDQVRNAMAGLRRVLFTWEPPG